MSKKRSLCQLAVLLVAASSPLAAQSTTTGAILGRVTDAAGKPLRGVQVRAASGQITRSTVTDESGGFRLTLLNPGAYQLSLSREGFQTLEGQPVQVGLNEAVSPQFKLAGLQEQVVEVVADAAKVDVSTTQMGTTFQLDTLDSIPKGRSLESLTYLSPGVVSSGMSSLFGASISGASGAENSYYIDGVNTTDSRYGGSGTSLVTDFLDQIEVQTGGFKPEYNALGGVVNVVTKSGTNDFKGSAWATWDPRGMVAAAKRTEWAVQSNPLSRYDLGAEVDGPIVKDRLFYATGFDTNITSNPETQTNFNGYSGSSVKNTTMQFFGKLNWYATPDLQFTLFGTSNPYTRDNSSDVAAYGDANTAFHEHDSNDAFSLSMDWNLRSDMTLSVKLGRSGTSTDVQPVDGATSVEDYRWYVYGPGAGTAVPSGTIYYRGGASYHETSSASSRQGRLDFTWFLGSHQLKAGFSTVSSDFSQDSWIGDKPTADTPAGMGGVVIIRSNGSATQAPGIRRLQEAFFNADSRSRVDAIYVQDTWEAAPGLRLLYGARAEDQRLMDADGITYLKFGFKEEFQPRVGLVWDPSNDGRSKFTANFARYNEVFPLRYGLRYRGGRYLYKRSTIAPGDPGTSYNNATGAFSFNQNAFTSFDADYSTPYNDPPVLEGTRPPQRDEVVVGYERSLGGHWSFSTHATYRKLTHPIEDMTPVDANGNPIDKGSAGYGQAVLGNPGPGTYRWVTRTDSQTSPGQEISWNSAFPAAYNLYRAVDFAVERQSGRHYLRFSYTLSRLFGDYEGVVSASNGQIDTNGTAAFDYPILVGTGPLSTDHTQVARLMGSDGFELGRGTLTFGYNLSFATGTPLSQLTGDPAQSGGTAVGNWTVPPPKDYAYYGAAIPTDFRYGQFGRSASLVDLDLDLNYAFKVAKLQVTPSLDLFNAFNSRRETGEQNAYIGDGVILNSWGKPNGYQSGRSVRFGIKVRF